MKQYTYAFETLDMYRLAVRVARWTRTVAWPRGNATLRDQAVRASQSVVLNIAEGRTRTGGARRNHYRIAHGSAGEVLAALDLIDLPGDEAHRLLLRRIGAMLMRSTQ